MNYRDKMWEMLGVEPNEEFKLGGALCTMIYLIDDEFNLWYKEEDSLYKRLSDYNVIDILCDPTLAIIKLPKKPTPTTQEQIAIDYAKACGCRWLAKDARGIVYGYKNKPVKTTDNSWRDKTLVYSVYIQIPISFLSWHDSEPYHIGDDSMAVLD